MRSNGKGITALTCVPGEPNFPIWVEDRTESSEHRPRAPACTIVTDMVKEEQQRESNRATTFPSEFKPRLEANMKHEEKVAKWIEKLPIRQMTPDTWSNECYEPMVLFSDVGTFDTDSENEFTDRDDIIEFQARLISFLFARNYWREDDQPLDPDEVLCEYE